MLLNDATSWKGGSTCSPGRKQVQRQGKITRKDRKEGSLSSWTLIQALFLSVAWGQISHEIKVKCLMLLYFFLLSFQAWYQIRSKCSRRKRWGTEEWKVPAVRCVSRGREDWWAADHLVLHVVVLGQSQGAAAITTMQSWEMVGRQKQQNKDINVQCLKFSEK